MVNVPAALLSTSASMVTAPLEVTLLLKRIPVLAFRVRAAPVEIAPLVLIDEVVVAVN